MPISATPAPPLAPKPLATRPSVRSHAPPTRTELRKRVRGTHRSPGPGGTRGTGQTVRRSRRHLPRHPPHDAEPAQRAWHPRHAGDGRRQFRSRHRHAGTGDRSRSGQPDVAHHAGRRLPHGLPARRGAGPGARSGRRPAAAGRHARQPRQGALRPRRAGRRAAAFSGRPGVRAGQPERPSRHRPDPAGPGRVPTGLDRIRMAQQARTGARAIPRHQRPAVERHAPAPGTRPAHCRSGLWRHDPVLPLHPARGRTVRGSDRGLRARLARHPVNRARHRPDVQRLAGHPRILGLQPFVQPPVRVRNRRRQHPRRRALSRA